MFRDCERIWFLSILSIIYTTIPFLCWGREVKFCLLMLTQDQDTVIWDCFKSIEGLVDAACIIETGSSDWTYHVAEEWVKNTKLPAIVYRSTKNKDNLSLVYQLGLRLLKENDFSLAHTYFLYLDADMTVQLLPDFQKNTLDQDGYLILNKCPSLGCSIYNLHLAKASLPLESVLNPVKLQNMIIEGGSTDLDRLARTHDELLHLAQVHKAKKEYETAIELYFKKIALGGTEEELWFSKFMIGSCYETLSQWEKALHWYMEAFQMCPDHPDSIRKIAMHYRYEGKNHLGYLFAKHGARIHRSLDQLLFDYPPLRDYHFDEEISIAAYYTPFQKEGFAAASDLSLRKNAPQWMRDQNGRNIFYYSPYLKEGRWSPIQLELPLIMANSKEQYHPKSLSLLKTPVGYQLVVTAVNYTQTGEKVIRTIDPTGVFRNKSFLIQLDQNFTVVDQREIMEDLSRERFPGFNMEGIKDYRLFEFNQESWFTCTMNDSSPTGYQQVSLGKLSDDSCGAVSIQQLIPLFQPDVYGDVEHWLPLIKNNQLQMIASYDPLVLLSPDLQTGECKMALTQKSLLNFSMLKGSAGPIPLDEGYLLLVHELVSYPDYTSAYLHRFLFLNASFIPEKISHPFAFLHRGVERCYGMIEDHSRSEFIFSLSIEDKDAYIFSLAIDAIRSLLHPLPEADPDPF